MAPTPMPQNAPNVTGGVLLGPKKPNVMIATPTVGPVPSESLIPYAMLLHSAAQAGFGLLPGVSSGADIATCRNQTVRHALQVPGLTHIMWIDPSVICPPDTVMRLLNRQRRVVGGLYHQKMPPFRPMVFQLDPFAMVEDIDLMAPTRVEGMGYGCLLVEIEVYREMAEAFGDGYWFELSGSGKSEDIFFFERLAKLDIPAWLDPTIRCGHIGTYAYSTEDWLRARQVVHG